ncbi:hypothetical protein KIP88_34805 [Bradyrhizobium sp. SRL28]|uniref:hypothetical protein n=1 Tax=Bradyrhizobium sp. SRL28 TaxID=2836178 RepID=UPI001BDDE555|nr:hypothetical protein [Bradyrhizobium sp. SRL28]MBT1515652.1 hypothetical protein [Bradyrhizobium sp. SRL28]
MLLDDLWRLDEQIIQLLDRKLEQEARKLQRRLDELGRQFGGGPATPRSVALPQGWAKVSKLKRPLRNVVLTRQTATLGNRAAILLTTFSQLVIGFLNVSPRAAAAAVARSGLIKNNPMVVDFKSAGVYYRPTTLRSR